MFRSLDTGVEVPGHLRFLGTLGIGYLSETFLIVVLLAVRLLYPLGLQRPTFPMDVTWLTPAFSAKAPEPAPVRVLSQPNHTALRVTTPVSAESIPAPAVDAPIASTEPSHVIPVLPMAMSKLPTLAPQPTLGSFTTQQPTHAPLPSRGEVQTGGFGDPNGLPGIGHGTGRLIAAGVGSFDLPRGDGRGNGMAGRSGVPGVVTKSAFSDAVTMKPSANSTIPIATTHAVQAGFGDVLPVVSIRPVPTQAPGPVVTPATIVVKPTPVYTNEARELRIEGEVVLEVMFLKSGRPEVTKILSKLGHGLDDSAMNAVSRIEFKPAQQAGVPVDSKAIVRVVFKLA